jgi:hypothetical protein
VIRFSLVLKAHSRHRRPGQDSVGIMKAYSEEMRPQRCPRRNFSWEYNAFAAVAVVLLTQAYAFVGPTCSPAFYSSSQSVVSRFSAVQPGFHPISGVGLQNRLRRSCTERFAGKALCLAMGHGYAPNSQREIPHQTNIDSIYYFEEEKTLPRLKRPEELKELIRICRCVRVISRIVVLTPL